MTTKKNRKNGPAEETKKRTVVGSFLRKVFVDNWGYKLISLVLAAFIWSVLIAQDPTITREKVITDATVTVSGTDAMKRNGFIVTSGLDEQLSNVSIRASVPQMQYQNVTASNYNPRIDLSRISVSGAQEARILTSNSATYGTVLDISPSTISLEVEDYITRYRIPVVRETVGSMPEGWYATSSTLDPSLLTISGPRSVVERVVRAEAVQDLSTVPATEGTQRSTLTFRLVDVNGESVESELLEVTSNSVLIDSVIVEQTVYPTKVLTFEDTGVVIGTPEEGYEVKSVTISPDSVRAAGRADTLDNLDEIFTDTTIDVTGLSASLSQTVRLRRPSELAYLSQDTVTIAVEIGDIISERIFSDVRINVVGVESTRTASLAERYADRIVIEGAQNWLSSLRQGQLSLSVDASGLMAGEYEVPVICDISGDDGQDYTVKISPATVKLTVRDR